MKVSDNQYDEKRLISRFKAGDTEVFSEIVTRYQKQIYRHIYRIVLDHDEADDLTQEVFIKVYKSLLNFREESGLYTWIYRIAVNYSLNRLKKIKSEKTVSINIVDFEIGSDGNISDEIDKKQKLLLLESAILALPEQQRTVFSLRYYEKMSYEEIASIMERSVGTIKANYFHAFKKLSDFMKKNLKESVQ